MVIGKKDQGKIEYGKKEQEKTNTEKKEQFTIVWRKLHFKTENNHFSYFFVILLY